MIATNSRIALRLAAVPIPCEQAGTEAIMGAEGAGEQPGHPITLRDGPFAGWKTWSLGGDPFEDQIGPFCFRVEDGAVRCAFSPTPNHLNGGGAIHGGALMSFADFSLFALAHETLQGQKAVTLTFNAEFVSAGDLDGWVEARGEVIRTTHTLVFVRGLLMQKGRPLLAFSATLKKIR